MKNFIKISIISCFVLLIVALPGTAASIEYISKFPESTLYPSEQVNLEFCIRDLSFNEKLELNTQLIDPVWTIEIKDGGETILLNGKGPTFILPKLDSKTVTVHLSGKTPIDISDKTISLIYIIDKESNRVIDSRLSKVYGTSSILQIIYKNDEIINDMKLTAKTLEKDGVNVTDIQNKLNEATKLNTEANNLYNKGDFISVKRNIQNVEQIISDIDATLEKAEGERQSIKQDKTRTQAIVSIVVVLVIIVIIIVLFIRRKRVPPRKKL